MLSNSRTTAPTADRQGYAWNMVLPPTTVR